MAVRTTETSVTFRRPFMLDAFDNPQPAGAYRLVIDDEEIEGLTFLAYRRTATMLHIPVASASFSLDDVYFVTASELAAAMEADARISLAFHGSRRQSCDI
jgi:hypothetical protein